MISRTGITLGVRQQSVARESDPEQVLSDLRRYYAPLPPEAFQKGHPGGMQVQGFGRRPLLQQIYWLQVVIEAWKEGFRVQDAIRFLLGGQNPVAVMRLLDRVKPKSSKISRHRDLYQDIPKTPVEGLKWAEPALARRVAAWLKASGTPLLPNRSSQEQPLLLSQGASLARLTTRRTRKRASSPAETDSTPSVDALPPPPFPLYHAPQRWTDASPSNHPSPRRKQTSPRRAPWA